MGEFVIAGHSQFFRNRVRQRGPGCLVYVTDFIYTTHLVHPTPDSIGDSALFDIELNRQYVILECHRFLS